MRVIRTLVWIVITAVLVAFIFMNLHGAAVNFWPLADGNYLHFNWPIGFIALVFFLLGLVPMWLLHKAASWRLQRRISALENSIRTAAPPPMIATSTQLEAEAAGGIPEDKPA